MNTCPPFVSIVARLDIQKKGCDRKMDDSKRECICECQYDKWLRAPLVRGGRKGKGVSTAQWKNLDQQRPKQLRVGLIEGVGEASLEENLEGMEKTLRVPVRMGDNGEFRKMHEKKDHSVEGMDSKDKEEGS